MIIQTERLMLREMTEADYPSLCRILQDREVMYAYNGPFTADEVRHWLDRQIVRYREDSHGLWAVVLKETGEMIGQCGLTWQDYNDYKVLEIGYLFQKAHWHRGYASEAAIACKDYAFNQLGADKVYSIIRDTNTASQKVAKRNGMTCVDTFIKHYRGMDMMHYLYCAERAKSI